MLVHCVIFIIVVGMIVCLYYLIFTIEKLIYWWDEGGVRGVSFYIWEEGEF